MLIFLHSDQVNVTNEYFSIMAKVTRFYEAFNSVLNS